MLFLLIVVLGVLFASFWLRAKRRQAPTRCLYVRDMRLSCRVGVYDHERQAPQPLRLWATVWLVPHRSAETQDSMFCYAELVQTLREFEHENHTPLLETLADSMVARIGQHPRAARVKLRLEKVDILPKVDGVGVEITQTFSSLLSFKSRPL